MTTTTEAPREGVVARVATEPMHVIVVETRNPAARAILTSWASRLVAAAWDVDPATGRQYPVKFDAFVTGPRDRVDVVPLDAPPSPLPAGEAAFLDTLACRLVDALDDLRRGSGADALAEIEEVAGALATLAGQPFPTARARRA